MPTWKEIQRRQNLDAHAQKERDEELRRDLISELKMRRINIAILFERIDQKIRAYRLEKLRQEIAERARRGQAAPHKEQQAKSQRARAERVLRRTRYLK